MERVIIELQIDVKNLNEEDRQLKIISAINDILPQEIAMTDGSNGEPIDEDDVATVANIAFTFLPHGSSLKAGEMKNPFSNVEVSKQN